jgi:excisionase family DNA binding protein
MGRREAQLTLEPAGPPTEAGREDASPTARSVESLAAATRRLAATIEATERLAEGSAEMLRTMDAAVGMNGRTTQRTAGVVSLAEAARRTGRHPEVLRRWCIDGRIQAVRVGRTWALTQETVAMLQRHSARARPRLTRAEPTA